MALQYGLLGLLTYQESTGYDLTKLFEDSLNNFWHAQSSQIYRELDRMEQKGWVASKNIVQEKRPNKRVYSITDDGRNALHEWMNQGSFKFEKSHEPLLMRVFFGADAPEVTLALLKACRDMCQAGLAEQLKNAQTAIEHYSAVTPNGERNRLYWQMTLDYGIAHTKTILQWAQQCIDKLEGVEQS